MDIPIELWDRILYFSQDLESAFQIAKVLSITRYPGYTLQRIVDLYADSLYNFGVKWCKTNEIAVCENSTYAYYIAGQILYIYSNYTYHLSNNIKLSYRCSYGYTSLSINNIRLCICYGQLMSIETNNEYITEFKINYYGRENHPIAFYIHSPHYESYEGECRNITDGPGYWVWKLPDKIITTRFGMIPIIDGIQSVERCKKDNKMEAIPLETTQKAFHTYKSLMMLLTKIKKLLSTYEDFEQRLEKPILIDSIEIKIPKLKTPKSQANYNRMKYF